MLNLPVCVWEVASGDLLSNEMEKRRISIFSPVIASQKRRDFVNCKFCLALPFSLQHLLVRASEEGVWMTGSDGNASTSEEKDKRRGRQRRNGNTCTQTVSEKEKGDASKSEVHCCVTVFAVGWNNDIVVHLDSYIQFGMCNIQKRKSKKLGKRMHKPTF